MGYEDVDAKCCVIHRQSAVALMERGWRSLKTRLVRQIPAQSLRCKLAQMLGTSHVTISAAYRRLGFVMVMMTALTTQMKNKTVLVSNRNFVFTVSTLIRVPGMF